MQRKKKKEKKPKNKKQKNFALRGQGFELSEPSAPLGPDQGSGAEIFTFLRAVYGRGEGWRADAGKERKRKQTALAIKYS